LDVEIGVLKYHLDRLQASLAGVTGGNYVHGHVYWGCVDCLQKFRQSIFFLVRVSR
jgi:hypothetical protein